MRPRLNPNPVLWSLVCALALVLAALLALQINGGFA